MMKNTWKRMIALVLALAMSLSLLSANVWAAELLPQEAETSTEEVDTLDDASLSAQISEEDTSEEAESKEETADESEDVAASEPEEQPEPEEPQSESMEQPKEAEEPDEEDNDQDKSGQAKSKESTDSDKPEKKGEEKDRGLTTQEVVASGEYGSDILWSLDDSGTLSFTGTGAMMDYTNGYNKPWGDWDSANVRRNIKKIVIGEGITRIGNGTFNETKQLKDVELPDSLTEIGSNAFGGCTNLTSITPSNNLLVIEQYAFYQCQNLKNLTLPSSLQRIDECAFAGCSSLEEVVIPSSVTTIRAGLFSDCKSLKKIYIPSSVKNISESMCFGCEMLEDVTLEQGLKTIGNSAFSGSTALKRITIPNSVNTIQNYAFQNSGLEAIYIPESVTDLGQGDFLGSSIVGTCPNLKTVVISENNPNYCSIDDVVYNKKKTSLLACARGKTGECLIPEGVNTIRHSAFLNCKDLTKITVPSSVYAIEVNAFLGCSWMKSAGPIGGGYNYEYSWDTEIPACAFRQCDYLTDIYLPERITTICGRAFYGTNSLKYLNLGNGVTTFKNGSFSDYFYPGTNSIGAPALEGVTIPVGVKTIPQDTFSACTNLKDVYYAGSQEEWNAISIGANNAPLTNATIHYNCSDTIPESDSICDLSLPRLDETNAKAFMGFIYNDPNYKEVDYSENKYYALLRGDYSKFSSADEVEEYILALSAFVRESMGQQSDKADALINHYTELVINHLEKKIGPDMDSEIVSEYSGRAKKRLEDGLLELFTTQVAEHCGIYVTENVLQNIEAVSTIYGSALSGAKRAEEYVNNIMAFIHGEILVMNYEVSGRAMYFSCYLDNRKNYTSADDWQFQTVMDTNFIACRDNSYASLLINYSTWLTGKDSWIDHRDTLDRWAEFLYQLETGSAGHTYTQKVIVKPTCQSKGKALFVCTGCSESHFEELPTLEHQLVKIDAVPATCETEGLIGCWECEICHEAFVDENGEFSLVTSKVIQPHGHKWGDWTVEAEPTETAKGLKKRICEYDASHVETKEIPYECIVSYKNTSSSGVTETVCIRTGSYTLPQCTTEAPEGKVFAGWQVGEAPELKLAGDIITVDENITITAIWCDTVVFAAYTTDGTASVGDITTSDGPFHAGDSVTVTAPAVDGYSFLGWYEVTGTEDGLVTAYGEDCLCDTLKYTFELTGETSIVAVYKARGNATVTIQAINGAKYTVGESSTVQYGSTETVKLGTTLTVTAQDAEQVLQWLNESDKVIGKSDVLSISITGNMTIKLVYKTDTANQSFVQFVSDYDQVLSYKQYSAADNIIFPDPPTKFGYDFNNWVFDGTEDEATENSIKSRIGTESLITLKPKYTKQATQHTITVNYEGVTRNADTYPNLEVGTGYSVYAPVIDGWIFQHWKNGDTIVGYKQEYFLQVDGDITLSAVYGNAEAEVKPVITLDEPYAVSENNVHKVACSAIRSIPEGYTLVEHGMLYARDVTGLTEETFVEGTTGVGKYISSGRQLNGVVKLNVKVATDDVVVSFRGYITLKNNKTGNVETVYTGIQSASYNSLNTNN